MSENGSYQAAHEAQSKNEGRITELTVKLRDSKIIENAPEGTVGEGSVVTIELNGDEMTYVLGSRDIVAGTDYDIMTPDSPIGKAIEGAKVGDVVSYTAPNGRELSVTVKAAKPLAWLSDWYAPVGGGILICRSAYCHRRRSPCRWPP